jgi:Rod binding domain-containing protein
MSPSAAIGPALARSGSASAEGRELREAAEAFESLFVQVLIEEMCNAQLRSGFFGQSAGASVYEGLFAGHLASRLSAGSPLGIAGLLEQGWSGQGADAAARVRTALDEIQAARATRAYLAAAAGLAPLSAPPGGSSMPQVQAPDADEWE